MLGVSFFMALLWLVVGKVLMKRGLLFSLAGLSLLLTQAQDLPDSMTFSRSNDSQVLIPAGTVYFNYDANGRVLTRTVSNDGFGSSFREEYVYDVNGNQLQYKRLRRYNNSPYFYTLDSIAYQYNADQLLVKRVIYYGYNQTDTLSLSQADSFVYGMDLNNRVNYREEYFAIDMVAGAMNWSDEGRDSIFYNGSDTLPNLINGYKWNQDSGQYIHTIIQDSLRWELDWDFENNFFASDEYYFERDSLGIFQNTGRRFTTGPSGRIESQIHMYNFPGSGFDTVTMYHFTWDKNGLLKLKEAYSNSSGVLKFHHGILDSLVYTFDRVTARYLLYENPGHYMVEYYEYHYATTGLADIDGKMAGFFPNPVGAGQKLFIQSESAIEQVQLYGYDGALVRTWKEYDPQGMDIQGISAGIYLVRLEDARGNTTTQRLQIR